MLNTRKSLALGITAWLQPLKSSTMSGFRPITRLRFDALRLAKSVLVTSLLVSGCSKQEAPIDAARAVGTASKDNALVVAGSSDETERLRTDNAKLRAEAILLRKLVEELSLTPQVLLARVTEALASDKSTEARQASEALDKRFPNSAQAKAAKDAVAKHEAAAMARELQAKAIEARGFYALQPQPTSTVSGVTVRVESLQVGGRWEFNVHGDEWQYRDVERGQRFVLLRAKLQSTDKSPELPDVAIYRIDGKKMTRLAQLSYEFRRWSSYGTFIGLYHDFSNDFAHTASVPFNAAASINEDDAKKPFAVVTTGQLCHERGSQIGQPEVVYRLRYDCESKTDLVAEDFAKGGYRILAFFNRPKGL